MLTVLSDNDPSGAHCMDKSYIGKRGWVFEFDRVTMFVTSFGPCYADCHARYGYECPQSYILFQPEISFAQHDIPSDTLHTNWDNPRTVRDRIRKAFRDNGQPYTLPESLSQPMAWEVVKPDSEFEETVIEWWIPQKRSLLNMSRQNSNKSGASDERTSLDYSCQFESITNNDVNNIGSTVAHILEDSVKKLHKRAELALESDCFNSDEPMVSLPSVTINHHLGDHSDAHQMALTHCQYISESSNDNDMLNGIIDNTSVTNTNTNNNSDKHRQTLTFLKSESLDSTYDIDPDDLLKTMPRVVDGDVVHVEDVDMFRDMDSFFKHRTSSI